MLAGIARLAIAAPRRVIAVTLLVMLGTAIFGIPVTKSLSAGGGLDPGAESSQASAVLSQKFDQGDVSMFITVTSDGGGQGRQATAVGTELVRRLENSANAGQVQSVWTSPATARSFISKDGKTGLIIAAISGGETNAQVNGSAFVTVGSTAPLYSTASAVQIDRLHAVPPPPLAKTVQLTGVAPSNRDSMHAISSRLPLVLIIIGVITLILVFLLTNSVVLPVERVLTNILSLTAAFGAVVWVFEEGHLGALGTVATGALGVQLPVLLFCIAFGLSMDYEVFLFSRIREYWLASHRGWGASDESVACGVAHTGRVITAAALIMVISSAALMAAQVSVMRLFGFGLTVAVLVDATLVRMLLVPAFMHGLGWLNWWVPNAPARLHDRFGLSETENQQSGLVVGRDVSLPRSRGTDWLSQR